MNLSSDTSTGDGYDVILESMRSLDLIFYRPKSESLSWTSKRTARKWSHVGLALHSTVVDPWTNTDKWFVAEPGSKADGFGIELHELRRMVRLYSGDISLGRLKDNPFQRCLRESQETYQQRTSELAGDLRLILYRYISKTTTEMSLVDFIKDRLLTGVHISSTDFATRVYQTLGIIPRSINSCLVQPQDLLEGSRSGIPKDFIQALRTIKTYNTCVRSKSCMASMNSARTRSVSPQTVKVRRTQRRSLPCSSTSSPQSRHLSPVHYRKRLLKSGSDMMVGCSLTLDHTV